MKKALLYARQSFGSEVESTSIEVQLEQCRQWASNNGCTIIGEFTDKNTSSELYPACKSGVEAAGIDKGFQAWLREQKTKGRKIYKEGLGKAFDKIEADKPDYLVVFTRNRLGRTAENSFLDRFFGSFLIENHCSLVLVESGTVIDFSDRLIGLLMQIKDSLDYQGLKEKRIASMESVSKRINGYRKWSNALGVRMNGECLEFDEKASSVILEIYDRFLKGEPLNSILDWMNREHRCLTKGKQFYESGLRNILKNPVYAGYMFNREGVLGKAVNIQAPIITLAIWQEAQTIMGIRKTNGTKCHVKGVKKHFLPLSGYLICTCGRRMTVAIDKGKIVYECINGGDHRNRLYVDDDFLKTVQSLFCLSLIEAQKRLVELNRGSGRVDTLRASLMRLQGSLRAKMSLVETDEDAFLFRKELESTKLEIKSIQSELQKEEAMDSTEQNRLKTQLEEDFFSLMERRLLEEGAFLRLLRTTVDKITVCNMELEALLKSGLKITIPRILGKHRSRKPMACTLLCDSHGDDILDIFHYQLHFHPQNKTMVLGGDLYFENDNISIFIHD